jgi:hypothetical protein
VVGVARQAHDGFHAEHVDERFGEALRVGAVAASESVTGQEVRARVGVDEQRPAFVRFPCRAAPPVESWEHGVAAVRQAFVGGVKFSEFVLYTSVSTTILVAVVF